MTPAEKERQWARYSRIALRSDMLCHGKANPDAVATVADAMLSLMEQREREGRFGPVADDVGCDAQDRNGCRFEADRQRERAQRAEAELAVRALVRDDIRAGPMCAYGCEAPSFREAALAGGWDGETERTFNECLNKTWVEHVRTCPNHPQRKVESLLKEALPLLRAWVMAGRPMEATAALLERARQEGFSDGE